MQTSFFYSSLDYILIFFCKDFYAQLIRDDLFLQNPNDETAKGKGKAIVKRITPVTIEKNCTKPIKSDEEIYKMFLKRYVESEEESEDSEEVYESSNGKL